MNIVLLEAGDYIDNDRVRLIDRRAQHILEILGAGINARIKIGNIDGLLGSGEILHIDDSAIELRVQLEHDPPPKLPLTIILALPRPKMLKRIFRSVAEFGVRELILINTAKVEKSYWQSPALAAEIIRYYCLDGLQQSGDTVLPIIRSERLFKPFVEDRLPAVIGDSLGLIAHPGLGTACPIGINRSCTLAIGPEGGFTEYEIEKLQQAGLRGVHLGPRILRVENALIALMTRLFAHY
ncbi:MAG TPA: 16S rRNA (uracil(1498)-N(3))-methyltransferase [Spongiibacteraceae bacterium]